MWFKLKLADSVSYKHRGSCQNVTFYEYPIPEIPDDCEKNSGTDRVWLKIIGSDRVSGTRQSLERELAEMGEFFLLSFFPSFFSSWGITGGRLERLEEERVLHLEELEEAKVRMEVFDKTRPDLKLVARKGMRRLLHW